MYRVLIDGSSFGGIRSGTCSSVDVALLALVEQEAAEYARRSGCSRTKADIAAYRAKRGAAGGANRATAQGP